MTTGKVIVIVLLVTYLEYLYVKQNAAKLLGNAVTGALPGVVGTAAGSLIQDIGSMFRGAQ